MSERTSPFIEKTLLTLTLVNLVNIASASTDHGRRYIVNMDSDPHPSAGDIAQGTQQPAAGVIGLQLVVLNVQGLLRALSDRPFEPLQPFAN